MQFAVRSKPSWRPPLSIRNIFRLVGLGRRCVHIARTFSRARARVDPGFRAVLFACLRVVDAGSSICRLMISNQGAAPQPRKGIEQRVSSGCAVSARAFADILAKF